MQKQYTIPLTTAVLAVGCAAALSPHQVKSRKNSPKPWGSYEAFSVDRISCMDHSMASTPQWRTNAGIKGERGPLSEKRGNGIVFKPEWDAPILLEKHGTAMAVNPFRQR